MSVRVLHVIEDFSSGNTGVTSVVRQIAQWQAKHCEWVGVYATGPIDLTPPVGVCVEVAALDEKYRSWRYPIDGMAGLQRFIVANGVTVVHLHGLWRAAPVLGIRAATALGLPTILSVHGQTSPWALGEQGVFKKVKKQLYWSLFAQREFKEVAVLHAITPLESEHIELFFNRADSVVIPNAIDLDFQDETLIPKEIPAHVFAFLGRLHPVKGVDILIEAFSSAKFEQADWRLVLAGPQEVPEYVARLRHLASSGGRCAQIEFAGPVFNQSKNDLLQGAWALIAPSHTEVVGMVNLEAAVWSTPSITTQQTGLKDWESGGGVLVSPTVDSLRSALENVSRWSMDDRVKRGQASRELVKARYSLAVAGPMWINLYKKLGSN